MSKTIRTNIEATRTRYRGVAPRGARSSGAGKKQAEGRFSEALRKARSGYEKHKPAYEQEWRTEQ